MYHTGLTVGGFTQPTVAKNLIEAQGNVEKGLSQRFLWLFPKPITIRFDDLEEIDSQFSTEMGKKISYGDLLYCIIS